MGPQHALGWDSSQSVGSGKQNVRTMMDSLVGLEVDLVILERLHALCQDGEDVPLLDGVVCGETWKMRHAISREVRREGTAPSCSLLQRLLAMRRYIGSDMPTLLNDPSAS